MTKIMLRKYVDDNDGNDSEVDDITMHSYDGIDDDDDDIDDNDVDDGTNRNTDSYRIIPSVATHQFLRTPLPEVVNINAVEGAALKI